MKRVLILSNKDFLHPFINPRIMRSITVAQEAGFIVDVACYSRFMRLPEQEVWKGIRIFRINPRGNLPKDLLFSVKTAALCKNTTYHLIHANELGSLVAGITAKIFTGAPLIYDSHELIWAMNQPWLINKLTFIKESLLLSFVSAVIHTNKYRLQEFIQAHQFLGKSKKTLVIENYVEKIELTLQEYLTRKKQLKKEKNIPEDHLVFIYQGEVGPLRKLDNVVNAFNQFHMEYRRSTLLLIGDLALSQKEIEGDDISFMPAMPREKLFDYLILSDVGISPLVNTCKNNYYPSSYKVYEYLATYNLIVAADFPAVKEELGTFAYYCDFDNVESIQQTLALVARHAKDASYLLSKHEQAHKLHEEKFNFDLIAPKLIGMYNSLANRPTKLKDLYGFVFRNFGWQSLFSTLYGINYGRTSEYVQVYNILKRYLKEKATILDVGGEGTFFPFFVAANNPDSAVFVCDILKMKVAPAMLNQTKLQNVYLLPETNFADITDCFDVIMAISTIEHTPSNDELKQLLKKVETNLHKGGLFIVTVPFTKNPTTVEIYSGAPKSGRNFRARYFSTTDIDRLIETTNLKLIRTAFWGEKKINWSKIMYHRYIRHSVRCLIFHPLSFLWDRLFISEGDIQAFPVKTDYSMIDYVLLVFQK